MPDAPAAGGVITYRVRVRTKAGGELIGPEVLRPAQPAAPAKTAPAAAPPAKASPKAPPKAAPKPAPKPAAKAAPKPAPKPAPKLVPEWVGEGGSHHFGHGQTSHVQLKAEGHEGKHVVFHVQSKQKDGTWLTTALLPAQVQQGIAKAPLLLTHATAGGSKASAEAVPVRFIAHLLEQPPPQTAKPGATIQAGTIIAPPKKSSAQSDRKAEWAWFQSLQKIEPAALKAGDILLQKTYDEDHPVRNAQRPLVAAKGTAYTCHAVVSLGGTRCVHAIETGVVEADLPDEFYLVYRATDGRHAGVAADVARWLSRSKIKYAWKHVFEAGAHTSVWGPKGEQRARMIAERKLPADQMMCSEMTTYCYQGTKDNPWIELDGMRVSPMRLEDWLNSNGAKFRFAGAIHAKNPRDYDLIDRVLAVTGAKAKVESLEAGIHQTVEKGKDALSKLGKLFKF